MAVGTSPQRVRMAPGPAPARVPDLDRLPRRGLEAPAQRGPRWSLPRTAAVAGVIVLVSLLMVVAASASMTQGQVRLTRLQTQLTAVLGRHHDLEQRVAKLSDPSGVVSQAQRHGLVAPTNVTDLNQVSTSASTSTASTTPAPGKTSAASTGGP